MEVNEAKAVDDAEDRGVRTNPDGKREDRRQGKGTRNDQYAEGVVQVFQQGIYPGSPGSGDQCISIAGRGAWRFSCLHALWRLPGNKRAIRVRG